ncbi:Spy/CpxP family protein refolding chaperone [Hymenobacter metallicola]|uniref:DUF4890 domain-containing protein n=1 Tax=Hymenobacter metallicola TaxID=2563114 RepID=A0A4Z0PW27_9BACT|nr:hypothetical protein [Hymenobacter metallicola]TGE21161.1 hypothetical protein E5K02_24430 [Hymenobacter metallicola]
MKRSLFSLLAAFALTIGAAAAQTQPSTPPVGGREHRQGTPEERATRRSQKLTQELGLSADQSSRIKQILLTRDQEMQALRTQGKPAEGASREQFGAQMKANRAKYDAQFKEVLTADQYTKYTQLQKNGRGHGHDGIDKAGKLKAKNGKLKVKQAQS